MENENNAGAAQAVDADLMPKRAAFIKWAAGRGLDVTEVRDAWGERRFLAPIIDGMWEGWFNASATPAVTDTGLLELRCQLWASKVSGAPITLSHLAAGALHSAMTTPPAPSSVHEAMQEARASLDEALASDEFRELKAEAQALSADGANWSMHVGCIFFLAMIERIESLSATKKDGERNERLFLAACGELGFVSEALGLHPDDGGAEPLITAIKALQAGVPAGWKAVPIEPTEDMVIDGFESVPDRHFDGDDYPEEYDAMSGCQQAGFRARRCWAAMLEAAPSAGSAP